MNNPMQMIMQALRGGMQPQQFLQQMAGQNPMIRQLQQITQGKNTQELMQIANNMAQQRGTTVQAIMQQMGLPINQ